MGTGRCVRGVISGFFCGLVPAAVPRRGARGRSDRWWGVGLS